MTTIQNLEALSLQDLFQYWQAAHGSRRMQPAGNACMLEILRRAAGGNQDAWAYFYQAYNALVHSWMIRYAGVLPQEERQSAANEAWARFAKQITPDKLTRFGAFAMIIQYLKRCASSVAIDTLRARDRLQVYEEELTQENASTLVLADPTLEAVFLGEVRTAFSRALEDEDEQLLAELILLQRMPVRDVCAMYPARFSGADLVYDRIRAIRERLRRDPDLLLLLGRRATGRRRQPKGVLHAG